MKCLIKEKAEAKAKAKDKAKAGVDIHPFHGNEGWSECCRGVLHPPRQHSEAHEECWCRCSGLNFFKDNRYVELWHPKKA